MQIFSVSIGVLPVCTVHIYQPCGRCWTMKIRKIKCWFVNDDTINKATIHAQYIPKIIAKLRVCLCFVMVINYTTSLKAFRKSLLIQRQTCDLRSGSEAPMHAFGEWITVTSLTNVGLLWLQQGSIVTSNVATTNCGMKQLIHYQNSMVQPLMFMNWKVISSISISCPCWDTIKQYQ